MKRPPPDRSELAAELHRGMPSRGGGPRAIRARAAFAKLIWKASSDRRLPSSMALDRAINALRPGDLDWLCEFNPLGPIYLLPTTRWVKALADELQRLEVRRVLEVAAGDGFLTAVLRKALPDVEVIASDSGAWEEAKARMNARERRALKKQTIAGLALGSDVLRLEARAAIRKVKPDLVLASWLPPGPLLDQLIRAKVPYVLDVGAAGGVTTSAWSWRYAHEFLEGPLESLGRCRLDERPKRELHTRVTLYYGASHPEHALERVRPGDWLWQFRPAK